MEFKSDVLIGWYLFYEYFIPMGLGSGLIINLNPYIALFGYPGLGLLLGLFVGPLIGFWLFKALFTLYGDTPIDLTVNDGILLLPDSGRTWRVDEVAAHRRWSLDPWQVVVLYDLRTGKEIARFVAFGRPDEVCALERALRPADANLV